MPPAANTMPTQAFVAASQQADKIYAAHRRLAKIAFKGDAQRQTDLHINDRKPKAYAPWYEQAPAISTLTCFLTVKRGIKSPPYSRHP